MQYPAAITNYSYMALAGVAQWIEHWPANQRVAGSIPSQGTCLACGPGPQCGVCESQPHIDVFLPLFLPPFPSLKINKIFKKNPSFSLYPKSMHGHLAPVQRALPDQEPYLADWAPLSSSELRFISIVSSVAGEAAWSSFLLSCLHFFLLRFFFFTELGVKTVSVSKMCEMSEL